MRLYKKMKNKSKIIVGLGISLAVLFFPIQGFSHEGSTTDNGDETFTYTQTINEGSGAPYYTAPSNGGGMGIYSFYSQDYGWQHDFPDYATANINITSATMTISAWDVDSEPKHGTGGEYDGLKVDTVDLDPGLLQGENNTTSITVFTIPLDNITDDGLMNVELDIDMNHETNTWATRLDSSILEIVYTKEVNTPPVVDSVKFDTSSPNAADGDDLVVEVEATDADGNPIDLSFRWYVDVGQGFYVDDEFAGRNDHTTHIVPAADTKAGDLWKVEVTPTDSTGAIGNKITAEMSVGFTNYYPSETTYNTLVFEDLWPTLGDFDMNDMVIWYRLMTVSNSSGEVEEIKFIGELVARGAGYGNSFGLSFSELAAANVASSSLTIDGNDISIEPEAGHDNANELVYILFKDARDYLPADVGNKIYYYNTEGDDQRPTVPITFSFTLTEPVSIGTISTATFNPFIVANGAYNRRGYEIHLPDHPPTALADVTLFGTKDDASDPSTSSYYKSSDNMPWALNIATEWYHPKELQNILPAYPEIEEWIESTGSKKSSWYSNSVKGKVWEKPE